MEYKIYAHNWYGGEVLTWAYNLVEAEQLRQKYEADGYTVKVSPEKEE